MVTVHGEVLDGFSIEAIPQFNTDDAFDWDALSERAGMRAVWLLYQLGKWEYLEDLGVNRAKVEPRLLAFSYGRTLTVRQIQQLKKKVPELVAASKELRLAYALKFYDKNVKEKEHDSKENNNDHVPRRGRKRRNDGADL